MQGMSPETDKIRNRQQEQAGKKKMNNSIFKTLELENNHILEIRDESRKIGEDAYVVIMGARMEIRVQQTLFAVKEVSDTQFADIRQTLGDNIFYEYKSERNMIMAKDKDQVFDAIVDTFLTNMVPYISKPIFPEKKVLKEYREKIEKKNLYR